MATKNLTGLIPGKTYNVVVRAKDSDGNYSPNSIIYQFTAPVKDLSGNQLVAKNIAVVTALAQSSASVVGGALTAGGLDDNGIKFAGKAQLADIWNNTASAIASMTGSANTGAVLINSTGILGYQFYTSSSGIANFFLNTADGNAYFRGTVYAGAGQIGGFTIGVSSLYAGSGSNFVGIIPASLPFFAGATDNIGTGSKFSVTNAGAITSTSGSIGGWSIDSTNIKSNINGRNIILSSASNSLSFTNTSGDIIASMISGSTQTGTTGLSEGLVIQLNSTPSYNILKYPNIGLTQGVNSLGTQGYVSLMGSSTTYVNIEPSSLFLYSSGGSFMSANAQISLTSNAAFSPYAQILLSNLGAIQMTAGGTTALTIDTSQNVTIGSGVVNIGQSGTTTISHMYGYYNFDDTYNRTSTTAANTLIATSPQGGLYRSTASSRRWKNSIGPISNNLDPNKLLNLPVRQFKFNNDYLLEEDQRYEQLVPGFIAEELFEIYPIATELDGDGKPMDWNSRFILPPMLKLIQEQANKIEELENRLALLENK